MTSIDWLLSVLIPALAANTAVLYGLWYWVRVRLINVSFERAINAAQSAMLVCMDEGPTFGSGAAGLGSDRTGRLLRAT